MSLGKRFFDVARANVNDFVRGFQGSEGDTELDIEPGELDATVGGRAGRAAGRAARRVRESAEEAWEQAFREAQARQRARLLGEEDPASKRLRWYATLEVSPGTDPDVIRRSYRRLLKQYHPDRFAKEPDKYQAATEVTRRLTEAYNGLKALSEV